MSVKKSCPIVRTPRVKQLEGMFDVPPAERSEQSWQVSLPLEELAWQVGLIVGPSGCGKTTIARELFADALAQNYGEARHWPQDKSIVDGFPPGMKIKELTGLLSSVGFSSPPSWLRPFHALSNGEQFRVTIARALAEKPELAVIDEFTSVVDRTVAKIGSAAIAKTVRRSKRRFVAVSCHYDVVDWLDPDWVFDPGLGSFEWRSLPAGADAGADADPAGPGSRGPTGRPAIELEIVRARRESWQLFKQHHYLSGELHRTATCFVALYEGRPAAFTAAIHNPSGGPGKGFWREHRTVCLPDFQGVGIGNALSDFVASLFAATGKRYFSTTSNPAMMQHRARSRLWKMHRLPSFGKKHTGSETAMNRTVAFTRLTAGFRYVGPRRPEEARRFGLKGVK